MEVYRTEEQQVEAIKSWWRSNGVAVLVGAVIGLGGLYGWRYYQSEVVESQVQSSKAYDEAMSVLTSNQKDGLSQVESFIANNDGSYANLLSLQLAKAFVESNELEKAASQLRLVQQQKDKALSALATIRLSRIQVELGNLDAALTELDKISAKGWKPQIEELRGDIKLRQGDKEAAAEAYAASLAVSASLVVQMKLDNISQ